MSFKLSKYKKYKRLDFKDGMVRPKMHKGHYSPYHYRLQKELCHYDNDYVMCFFDDGHEEEGLIVKETGNNKKTYKIHDSDGYDFFKDGE
jgi:hypothetical protein